MTVSVSELVAVDGLYNEHKEMNALESTICGILCYVSEVSLMDVFLRCCAGGRRMTHADKCFKSPGITTSAKTM